MLKYQFFWVSTASNRHIMPPTRPSQQHRVGIWYFGLLYIYFFSMIWALSSIAPVRQSLITLFSAYMFHLCNAFLFESFFLLLRLHSFFPITYHWCRILCFSNRICVDDRYLTKIKIKSGKIWRKKRYFFVLPKSVLYI